MDKELPCVLVLGPSGCGRHTLADALAKHLDASHDNPFRSLTPSDGGMFKCATVGIDTRYYAADVTLLLQTTPDAEFTQREDPVVDSVLERTQAVIFAFDASNAFSFGAMQSFFESVDERSFETVLCVANKADLVEDSVSKKAEEEWQQWCRENMVEYVEVDSVRGPNEKVEQGQEKVKFHRVVEALQVTMWTNMQRKPLLSRVGMEEIGVKAEEQKDIGLAAVEAELPELCTSMHNEETTNDRDEVQLDDLFRLVNEMKSVREIANDLPDEDRRQAAADMALKLLEKLGLEEE